MELVARFRAAAQDERQTLFGDLEAALLEYPDDGSATADKEWWGTFSLLFADPDGWPLTLAPLELGARVRTRLASSGETCGVLEAHLTDRLLRAHLDGVPGPELDRCHDAQHPERYARTGSWEHSWSLILSAMALRRAGRTDLALRSLSHTDDACALESGPARLERCYAAVELGSCFQELGRYADASRVLNEMQVFIEAWKATSVKAEKDRTTCLSIIGLARMRQYCNEGRAAEAVDEIERVREFTTDARLLAQFDYYHAVALRLADGDVGQRAQHLSAAIDSPDMDSGMRVMALLERVSLLVDEGRPDDAAESLELARAQIEDEAITWPSLHARASAFESRLARSRGLTPEQALKQLARVREAYYEYLRTCRVTNDGLGIGILALPERRYLVGELIEMTLAAKPGVAGVEAALEDVFAVRSGGALARSLDASKPSLAELRACLLRETADGMLVFVPGVDHTHLFAFDRKRVLHVSLPSTRELGKPLADLWRELGNAPRGSLKRKRARYESMARALGAKVFPADVAALVGEWERVQVVGANLLQRIPLEVLIVEGVGVLGLERQVVNLPSAAVGIALAKGEYRAPSEGALLALVSPSLAPGAKQEVPLQFHEAARARIQNAWGEGRLRWNSGAKATLESLAKPPPLSTLLIFAHGGRDISRSRPLSVRVAPSKEVPSGELFATDVEALSRSAVPPIVVLATCGGGAGELKVGSDDGDHLGAYFLRRGARLALMSSAPLEQNATAILCAAFLDELNQGTSPAEAIRRARVELRANPLFDHPYYWGTLVAFGWDGP